MKKQNWKKNKKSTASLRKILFMLSKDLPALADDLIGTTWQKRNKFDLIIVNPLHGVCGCDISNNAELRHFLRELIDPVIKAEETKCALMLIHHTNKPPAPRDRGGFGTDRYAEYVGAGGAELTNWMRAMLAIMPTVEEGVFDLVAAKLGKRLGWPRKDGDKSYNPHKTIVHSDGGLIFWRASVYLLISGTGHILIARL